MITGYNTDVPHSGVVFHVQTEDKGIASAFIESLVYVGGQILAKKRTSYKSALEAGDSKKQIVELMDRQHRLKDKIGTAMSWIYSKISSAVNEEEEEEEGEDYVRRPPDNRRPPPPRRRDEGKDDFARRRPGRRREPPPRRREGPR